MTAPHSSPITSSPHICWGVVDENLLLFNPSDRRLHVLNNTAAMVWAMADGKKAMPELVETLSIEYGVDAPSIESDVYEVTDRLLDSGLCNFLEDSDSQWQPPRPRSSIGPDLPDFGESDVIGPYDAMGVAVAVSVADEALRTELQRVLDPIAAPGLDVENVKGRMVFEIFDDELGFNLRVNGEYLARGTTRPLALRALLSDMNSRAIGFLDESLVLHASAAEIRGTLVVLPGVANSGKSTLVTELCDRGASYLTDEAVAIRHNGLRARPYHKSICIERGSQSRFSHLLPDGTSPARGMTWDVDPRLVGPGELSLGGDVSALVFAIYRPHTPTPIFRKIEKVETMHRLIANSFDFSAIGQPAFAVLIRLANKLPAYELAHGGQNHLALIEDLARSQQRDAAA